MSKRTMFTALVCSALSTPLWANDQNINYNLINLQAEASRQVSNDEMNAVLFIEKSNKQPAELAQQITKALNLAMQQAKQYPSVKLTTGTQSTYPIYQDNQKLSQWRGRAEIRLESTDFKAASQLIADLQQHFQTQSVGFAVSEKRHQQVEAELITEASKNFQARAQSLAQSWQKSQYALVTLNINTNNYVQPPMYMRAEMAKVSMMADSTPQEVSAGESKITVTANGSIQLK